jgi:hypothetical protein
MGQTMGFLSRQPFALLGALGLISLVQDLLQWQEQIGLWIDAWQAVTRPIIQFLFGWIPALLKWPFPWWAQDYLTLSLISAGAFVRAAVVTNIDDFNRRLTDDKLSVYIGLTLFYIFAIFIWPVAVVFKVIPDLARSYKSNKEISGTLVFLETFVWAALIIAINYALLFAGTR